MKYQLSLWQKTDLRARNEIKEELSFCHISGESTSRKECIGSINPNGDETELYAIYWSLITISTVGYGDLHAENATEKVFSISSTGSSILASLVTVLEHFRFS
ncbi:Ankyrin repeat-containing protein [Artemisia annua]|uniref:Ankyrin repeat-containing protein n=1 Tax=Artemisia annua TaxID=35608 RepID=A0A2U1PYS8_ARTAN|nr:Ankyrin repeat-containing protein [Artemisia annua]